MLSMLLLSVANATVWNEVDDPTVSELEAATVAEPYWINFSYPVNNVFIDFSDVEFSYDSTNMTFVFWAYNSTVGLGNASLGVYYKIGDWTSYNLEAGTYYLSDEYYVIESDFVLTDGYNWTVMCGDADPVSDIIYVNGTAAYSGNSLGFDPVFYESISIFKEGAGSVFEGDGSTETVYYESSTAAVTWGSAQMIGILLALVPVMLIIKVFKRIG